MRSSPFDTPGYAVEWDESVLAQLFGAIGALEEIDPFARSLGDDLYWLLTQKRLSDLLIVYGESVANRFTPWPAADRALARAYQELLEPDVSIRFWQRAIAAAPYELDDYLRCADVAMEAEQPEVAVDTMRQALKLQPGRFDLRRALGLALQAGQDAAGEPLLRELLELSPEDNLIREALGLELVPEFDDGHDDH
jgi:tetratricopeptide (TPR) repeat protein